MSLQVTDPSIEPSGFWQAITPSDSVVLTKVRGVYVGDISGGATLTMKDQNGASVPFTVVAGQLLPVSPSKIMATGTTASGIVALK